MGTTLSPATPRPSRFSSPTRYSMNAPLVSKRSIAGIRAVAVVLAFYCVWPGGQASGDMILTLTGQPGSALVAFTLAGTSTATSNFGTPYLGKVFDVNDGSDLFPPEITNANAPFGIYALASGGGTVSNLTAGTSSAVTGVTLQDTQLFGVARFGVDFSPSQSVAVGDSFVWSGAGTFDLSISNLTFSDLSQGSSTGTTQVGGLPGTLIIVPEPATSTSLILSAVGLLVIRRRATLINSFLRLFTPGRAAC